MPLTPGASGGFVLHQAAFCAAITPSCGGLNYTLLMRAALIIITVSVSDSIWTQLKGEIHIRIGIVPLTRAVN